MGFFQKLFHRKEGEGSPTHDDGLAAEHLVLRRAIERCDALKFAVDAGQLTVAEVIEKLLQNDFPKAVVKKAIAESFGDEVAAKHVK